MGKKVSKNQVVALDDHDDDVEELAAEPKKNTFFLTRAIALQVGANKAFVLDLIVS